MQLRPIDLPMLTALSSAAAAQQLGGCIAIRGTPMG